MDKPTRLAGSEDSDFSGTADSASEQAPGATGVFESVKSSETPEKPSASWGKGQLQESAPAEDRRRPQPASGAETLAEPVVHKVVLGGGISTDSMQLLSRMRRASDVKAPESKRPPSKEAGGTPGTVGEDATGREASGAGFTQILRSLGVDSEAPTASKKPILESDTLPPTQSAWFASRFPPAGTAEAKRSDFNQFSTPQSPASSPASEMATEAAGASQPGEFTKLLRAPQYGSTDSSVFPKPDASAGKGSEGIGAAGGARNSSKDQPGEFTKLLSSLEGSPADSSSPTIRPEAGRSSRAIGGSFTEMLAMEQRSAPVESGIFNERRPAGGARNFDLPIPANNQPAAGPGSFASRERVDAPPDQSGQQGASPGITRLIQMLDSSSNSTSPVVEPTLASPVPQTGPGAWTKTFTSLDDPSEQPGAAAVKAPYRPLSQDRSGSVGAVTGQGTETPGRLNEGATPASPLPSGSAGPSEYTRIIDASRMRESAMRESQAQGHSAQATPSRPAAPAVPPPVQVQMPSYPISVAPGMVGMQGMGNMPHIGGVGSGQPLQVPGYPMNIGPHGGSIPGMGGSMPMAPGMYVPAIPQPSAPQVPPAKPAPTGMGKLQQYVPLLLVLIIFLLVGLLVTVVFLLKH